jgi:hypothetical protein
MIPKGTYSPTTTYDPLDAVKYEHNSYVCKQTSRGNLPTNTTYWQPLTDVTADEIPTEGSTNLVQSGGVYSANQTLTNQVKDMNNVYGSKNLLPFNLVDIVAKNTNGTWSGNKYTVSGVTYTFNADGTITINGTRTTAGGITISEFSLEAGKKYKYSIGNPFNLSNTAGSNIQGYDGTTWVALGNIFGTETEAEFESNSAYSKYRVNINSNNGVTFSNLTIKPMIRLASIEDDTYQPYAMTNQQLTQDTTALLDNAEVNGAVNMLPNNATTQVINGVTFTVNLDKTVTVSGTQTSSPLGLLLNTDFSNLENGKTYKVTGSNGTSGRTEVLEIRDETAGTNIVEQEAGVAAEFTYNSSHTYKASITLRNNGTTHSTTFKPMITVPSYNGDYVPYAKSNKELTEDVADIKATIVQKVSSNSPGTVYDINFSNASYPRALVVSSYTYGTLAYWSGTLHYIPIAKNDSMASVTASNESSNGIRLTFSSGDTPTLIPLNTDASIWTITKVS